MLHGLSKQWLTLIAYQSIRLFVKHYVWQISTVAQWIKPLPATGIPRECRSVDTLLPVQLSANVPGKANENDLSA